MLAWFGGAWVFGNRQQACQVWDALDSHIVCDLAESFESLSLLFAVLSRLAVLVLIHGNDRRGNDGRTSLGLLHELDVMPER